MQIALEGLDRILREGSLLCADPVDKCPQYYMSYHLFVLLACYIIACIIDNIFKIIYVGLDESGFK